MKKQKKWSGADNMKHLKNYVLSLGIDPKNFYDTITNGGYTRENIVMCHMITDRVVNMPSAKALEQWANIYIRCFFPNALAE